MAFKIIWSRQSQDDLHDLREIVTFIAGDNPSVAERIDCQIISRVGSLANFSELGRPVPEEQDPTVREIVVHPYRIIYKLQVEQRTVAIVRIWHGGRGDLAIPGRLVF